MPTPRRLLSAANAAMALTGRTRSPQQLWQRMADQCEQKIGHVPTGPEADALYRLTEAFCATEGLSPMGRTTIELSHVGPRLENLARVQAIHRDHPEVGHERIDRPIFVVGMPRTATTLALGLLAGADGHRGPLMYEMEHTALHYDNPEQAMRDSEKRIKILHFFQPGYRDVHELRARGPEESYFCEIASRFFLCSAPLPGYRQMLDQTDPVPNYLHIKRVLQVLQHGRQPARWVLKQPAHLWHLDTIRQVFPDAVFVWTHRDPETVFGSTCSMVESMQRMHLHPSAVDLKEIGETWLNLLSEAVRTARQARVGMSRDAIIDVPYHHLTQDAFEQVPQLYERLGARWTGDDEQRLQAFFSTHDKRRRHDYTSRRYGIEPDEVYDAFDDYPHMVAGLNSGMW